MIIIIISVIVSGALSFIGHVFTLIMCSAEIFSVNQLALVNKKKIKACQQSISADGMGLLPGRKAAVPEESLHMIKGGTEQCRC